MTYEEALAAIGALASRGWRLGLDRMRVYAERGGLGDMLSRDSQPRFIQIAGTNGKGSVTAMVQSMMIAQGHRTGGFFSPFVYDPRERWQVQGELLSKEKVAALAERLLNVAADMEGTEFGGVTEFEVKTALGLAAWQDADCDWVALEVGLGGRLDATTIVDPAAGVIVSIGLDHVSILGNTHAEIATEKAGICKSGMPLVVGEVNPESKAAIQKVAAEVGAKPLWFGEDYSYDSTENGLIVRTPNYHYENLAVPLLGPIQHHNAAVAIVAMEAAGAISDPSKIRTGLAQTRIPGRYEVRYIGEQKIILDGAHNLEAAQALVEGLKANGESDLILVASMLQGHEAIPFFETFRGLVDRVVVGEINFHRKQALASLEIQAKAIFDSVQGCPNATEALSFAKSLAAPGQTILVTGSYYWVGEIGNLLPS